MALTDSGLQKIIKDTEKAIATGVGKIIKSMCTFARFFELFCKVFCTAHPKKNGAKKVQNHPKTLAPLSHVKAGYNFCQPTGTLFR